MSGPAGTPPQEFAPAICWDCARKRAAVVTAGETGRDEACIICGKPTKGRNYEVLPHEVDALTSPRQPKKFLCMNAFGCQRETVCSETCALYVEHVDATGTRPPAPAAPAAPSTVGSLLGTGDTLAAIVGRDTSAVPVEARVAESVPFVPSRSDIGRPTVIVTQDIVDRMGVSPDLLGLPAGVAADGSLVFAAARTHEARHPPPWRWEVTQSSAVLVDDIGQQIVLLERDYFEDASARVRALIKLAPNLERLREIEWQGAPVEDGGYNCCPNPRCAGDPTRGHETDCWIGNTVAALDAAKAGR